MFEYTKTFGPAHSLVVVAVGSIYVLPYCPCGWVGTSERPAEIGANLDLTDQFARHIEREAEYRRRHVVDEGTAVV